MGPSWEAGTRKRGEGLSNVYTEIVVPRGYPVHAGIVFLAWARKILRGRESLIRATKTPDPFDPLEFSRTNKYQPI
jgi:hypothetical protein